MSTKLELLQPHQLSNLFPPLTEPELKALADDIKANGLRHSIVTFEDCTLDGVNREKACLMVGVEPTYTPFQGDYAGAVAFVVSANLQRRHLTQSQRAAIAAQLETMTHGGNRKKVNGQDAPARVDRAAAAAALNVSERSVADAAAVKKYGTPELQESVSDGTMQVKPAAKLARKPAEEQRKAVKEAKAKKTAKAAASVAPKKRGKAVPKAKTSNGKAKEVAAPSAKHFKDAVNAFASAAEHLFNPKWMTVIDHQKLPSEHRERVIKYLLKVIQNAKALHDKLEGWK